MCDGQPVAVFATRLRPSRGRVVVDVGTVDSQIHSFLRIVESAIPPADIDDDDKVGPWRLIVNFSAICRSDSVGREFRYESVEVYGLPILTELCRPDFPALYQFCQFRVLLCVFSALRGQSLLNRLRIHHAPLRFAALQIER